MSYGYTASVIGQTLVSFKHRNPYNPVITVKTQGQPSFIEYFQLDTRSNGTDLLSAMNGVFQTGGVIGTLILPWIADKWGRKWAIAVVGFVIDTRA